jgi:type II secretory pathway predicted ATPase ExeA
MAATNLQPGTSSGSQPDYYPSALHEEALARLEYLKGKGSACGLLLGPAGCGKSLVLNRFAQRQRKAGAAAASVTALGVDVREFLQAISADWGFSTASNVSRLWQDAAVRLRVLTLEEVPAILLIDDLDQACEEVARLVDRLQAFAESAGANLILVAAANSHSLGLLSVRLLARSQLQADLDQWTLEESSGFLQDWLAVRTGGDQEFDAPALQVLHELAEGNPRRVRQLAELTLVASPGTGSLSEDIVEAAYLEMTERR